MWWDFLCFKIIESGRYLLSQELQETFSDVWIYLCKSVLYVKPLWVLFTSVVYYVLFPNETFIPATIALINVLVIDIITKYYSISVMNGGLIN